MSNKWFDEGNLDPWAARSETSLGRVYSEEEHRFRPAFTRDRDRVVHCSAFRRLEFKTQVFAYFENDYYRTRLTHTIEVAQIARTLSRLLGGNADLAEAVALAHDMGHPPFGHAGEGALSAWAEAVGGFNHNIQGLRIVDQLELKYAAFPGLNLTYEVREAFAKHGSGRLHMTEEFSQTGPQPTLEAQLADLSDGIAYNAHDLDDGLAGGLLSWEQVMELAPVATLVHDHNLLSETMEIRRSELVRRLINRFVTDAWHTTREAIAQADVSSVAEVRACSDPLAKLSDPAAVELAEIKSFLHETLYRHPRVMRMSHKAARRLRAMCDVLGDDPAQLDPRWQQVADREGSARAICDYVASLTDKSAIELHAQLFDPASGIGYP